MAQLVVTMRVMPEGPEADLNSVKKEIEKKITKFAGKTAIKFEESPIGFGLVALNVMFVMDEKGESTDKLEEDIRRIEGAGSVEVTDMRRGLG